MLQSKGAAGHKVERRKTTDHEVVILVVKILGLVVGMLALALTIGLIICIYYSAVTGKEMPITMAILAGVSNICSAALGFIGGLLANAFRSTGSADNLPAAIGNAVVNASKEEPISTTLNDDSGSDSDSASTPAPVALRPVTPPQKMEINRAAFDDALSRGVVNPAPSVAPAPAVAQLEFPAAVDDSTRRGVELEYAHEPTENERAIHENAKNPGYFAESNAVPDVLKAEPTVLAPLDEAKHSSGTGTDLADKDGEL